MGIFGRVGSGAAFLLELLRSERKGLSKGFLLPAVDLGEEVEEKGLDLGTREGEDR